MDFMAFVSECRPFFLKLQNSRQKIVAAEKSNYHDSRNKWNQCVAVKGKRALFEDIFSEDAAVKTQEKSHMLTHKRLSNLHLCTKAKQ